MNKSQQAAALLHKVKPKIVTKRSPEKVTALWRVFGKQTKLIVWRSHLVWASRVLRVVPFAFERGDFHCWLHFEGMVDFGRDGFLMTGTVLLKFGFRICVAVKV